MKLFTFRTKDGFAKDMPAPGAKYHVLMCNDGSERTYEMVALHGRTAGERLYEYQEKCERHAVTFLDDPSALKKERDELKEELGRLHMTITKEPEAPAIRRELENMKAKYTELELNTRYMDSNLNDWVGEAKRFERERNEARVQVAWLERELKLEKAKNARKRGL